MVQFFSIVSLLFFLLSGIIYFYAIPKMRNLSNNEINQYKDSFPQKSYELEMELRGQEKAYHTILTWTIVIALICSGIAGGFIREDY